MTLINAARFTAFAPRALPGTLSALEASATRHNLTEPLVLAGWLGQMHHESQGFARLSESLNYSVEGLMATFGRHRISEADCRKFGRTKTQAANQNAIANIVYGGEWGRKNLGNTEPGDGWLYRGGGFKMNTGRANYREAGHENDPDTLRTDVWAAAEASAVFFVNHGCIPLARADDVVGLTKRINGGAIGLAERRALTATAKHVVGL